MSTCAWKAATNAQSKSHGETPHSSARTPSSMRIHQNLPKTAIKHLRLLISEDFPQKEHHAMAKTAKAYRFLTLTAWPCGAARAHMRFRNCCAHAFINLDFAKNLGDCALTQGHRALTAGNLALTQSNRALTRRHRALTEGHRAPTSRQPGADSKQPGPCLKATGR